MEHDENLPSTALREAYDSLTSDPQIPHHSDRFRLGLALRPPSRMVCSAADLPPRRATAQKDTVKLRELNSCDRLSGRRCFGASDVLTKPPERRGVLWPLNGGGRRAGGCAFWGGCGGRWGS